jgi:hypothetical protein
MLNGSQAKQNFAAFSNSILLRQGIDQSFMPLYILVPYRRQIPYPVAAR